MRCCPAPPDRPAGRQRLDAVAQRFESGLEAGAVRCDLEDDRAALVSRTVTVVCAPARSERLETAPVDRPRDLGREACSARDVERDADAGAQRRRT